MTSEGRLSEGPTKDWLDALLTDVGKALLAEASAALALDPSASLRLGERLRREHPPELVASAFTLAELRQRAREKFSLADRMYVTREGLEQASSERVARHRAERLRLFESIADLCCGIGGDLMQLGQAQSARVVAVDRDPLHLRMACMNAGLAGIVEPQLRTVCDDVRRVDLEAFGLDAVFVDPARRTGGSRMRLSSGASDPPLSWCVSLVARVRSGAVAVKTAPGLPHALVPPDWEAEFVSEGRALKECTLWSPALATAQRRATVLDADVSLYGSADAPPEVPIAAPGAHLIDPDSAVTRAGLVEHLAASLRPDVWKIDPQIAFLSSDRHIQTPFGRTLRVVESLPWNLKRLREVLRRLEIGSVDIRKRGSAVDVADIRTRLRLHGDRSATVVLTRVNDRPWALVCEPA